MGPTLSTYFILVVEEGHYTQKAVLEFCICKLIILSSSLYILIYLKIKEAVHQNI